ncbi:MAG TPA: hypothetical protein VNT76_00115, partial [Candidatus Binatus sp.]|nr:hypothetical protein [Candidatus Binatus sp.]
MKSKNCNIPRKVSEQYGVDDKGLMGFGPDASNVTVTEDPLPLHFFAANSFAAAAESEKSKMVDAGRS